MKQAMRSVASAAIILSFAFSAVAQKASVKTAILERNVRAEMSFLASDAMQGRGSGSQFERVAAEYIGSQFMRFGLEPAGENGWDGRPTYVQTVTVPGRETLGDLKFVMLDGVPPVYGRDFVVLSIGTKDIEGPIQKVKAGDTASKGAIVLYEPSPDAKLSDLQPVLTKFRQDGAAAVIVRETKEIRENWSTIAAQKLGLSRRGSLLVFSEKTFEGLASGPEVTTIKFAGQFAADANTNTWNAIGKITGSDPALGSQVVLISSHLDHLGVAERPGASRADSLLPSRHRACRD